MPDILAPRIEYKPFEYPQYFEFFQKQNQAHWLPSEVPMEADINDFRTVLTPEEKSLVVNVLRFFTQGDVEINNNYNTNLIPKFHKPEIKMMLSAFAAAEGVHVWAYSHLNDTLGLNNSDYKIFLDIPSMKRKYDFLRAHDTDSDASLALNLAIFGGLMEGVSLFSSFAMLMHFQRLGKLKGLGQIVTWSAKDENLHSEGVSRLFRDFCAEKPELAGYLKEQVEKACGEMVALECDFIDTCFSAGNIAGLDKDDLKKYIQYISNQRMKGLGYDGIFKIDSNPLPWMDVALGANEHSNFFEAKVTSYSKGSINWDN